MTIDVLHNDHRSSRPATLTIRCGGLSIADGQIIAQHPSGATRVFESNELEAADRWWEARDLEQQCGGR